MEIIFLVMGLGLCSLGVMFLKQVSRASRFAKVQGTVIAYVGDASAYFPMVEYLHPQGEMRYLKWPVGRAKQFCFPIGAEVQVLVDPLDMDRAMASSPIYSRMGWFFIALGLVMCAVFRSLCHMDTRNLGFAIYIVASVVFSIIGQKNKWKNLGILAVTKGFFTSGVFKTFDPKDKITPSSNWNRAA